MSGGRAGLDWLLDCSACGATAEPSGLPTVCRACGQPWLVRYPDRRLTLADRAEIHRGQGMFRFRKFLPLAEHESPVTLGEGDTPLLAIGRAGERLGFSDLWLKDEGANPTGSFKSRGLAMAVTRAVHGGAAAFVVPTAGNAGVALAAYAARAGVPARVYAPATTPAAILAQIRGFGGDLELLDGHIGDCGAAALDFARRTGAFPMSTLREPYRIEGKKTLGLELARQLGWKMPDAIIYPAGGGTGLIGMWLAFKELTAVGWVTGSLPRLYAVQSTGCAPVVRAVAAGADRCDPWPDPWTVASGLRVPAPLGGPLMLRAIRDTGGGAVAVSDEDLMEQARAVSMLEGVDVGPEGGAALAAAVALREAGAIGADERVVIFNTGAGWLYRG
jgi:threonine synthase